MESIPSTFLRYVDVIILYCQDCTATVKLSEMQVLLKRAVFESAAIVMELYTLLPKQHVHLVTTPREVVR